MCKAVGKSSTPMHHDPNIFTDGLPITQPTVVRALKGVDKFIDTLL